MTSIPDGWKLKKIKDIAKVSSGGTPSRKNKLFWQGDIPWVTTAEVCSNTIIDTEQKISAAGLNGSSAKIFPKNTILMAMYGQGKTRGQVAKLGIKASTNQACAAILLKDNFDTDFYFLYLQSQYQSIRDLSNSGGQKNLSAGLVKSINVPVPPLPEQKKIAQILTTWDQAIEVTENLLKNSQQQKKALMQQLLDNPEWPELKLGDVGRISSAGVDKKLNDDEQPVRLLNYMDAYKYDYIDDHHLDHWVTASDRKIAQCNVKSGDVFFTPSSETRTDIAQSAVAANDIKNAAYSYHVIRFRASQDWDLNFKAFVFKAPSFFRQAYRLCDGSGQRYVLSQDYFRSMTIRVPSNEEQKRIGLILKAAHDEIKLLQEKIEHLKREKKALMQQLLTGKCRVIVDERDPKKEVRHG